MRSVRKLRTVIVYHELYVAHDLGVAPVSLFTDFAVAIAQDARGLRVEDEGDG